MNYTQILYIYNNSLDIYNNSNQKFSKKLITITSIKYNNLF